MSKCKKCGKEIQTTLPRRLCDVCKKEVKRERRKKYYNKEYYREYMRCVRGYREPNECKYCGAIVQPGKNKRTVCDNCKNFRYRLRVYRHQTCYWQDGERLY